MTDESQPKTLYVGNLDHTVSEELLVALFSQMGSIKNCKIIREPGNDPYAFIEFSTHQAASTALTAMNKRSFLDKEMKVNWATSPGNQPKTDTSTHHHIFVGDLSPEIETETLREAFAPFGEISNCRIVRDPQTLKSKGYAFVSFVKKAEAENAIQAMNGQWLGSRSIRTNWSTRKPPPPREATKGIKGNKPSYDDVYNQTSATNTTVYCGGFPANAISEDLMLKHFGQFGTIQDVRVFKDKGFAFVKFLTKHAATHAIESTHNSDICGHTVKCFWGKENGGDMTSNSQSHLPQSSSSSNLGGGGGGNGSNHQMQQQGGGASAGQQYPYSYPHVGYWYQSNYPAPTASQIQAHYLQQQGYYPYATAYSPAALAAAASPQQQNAAAAAGAAYRMMQPNMQWNMQAAAAAAASVQGAAAVANGTSAQPQMMYTTAMPQYQTQ